MASEPEPEHGSSIGSGFAVAVAIVTSLRPEHSSVPWGEIVFISIAVLGIEMRCEEKLDNFESPVTHPTEVTVTLV
ncbi:MAG: hypothetical protein J07HQW2_01932 [Haloquadratum walsbyi J07HQW2]|uniref:Uncharacterized protein n=1 Tax=Haloquadratum walsbyi J07HQW2 TaxID=1238425 RepID=U1NEM9_9EURY|nr:MAG: hypothetical protein J07HQW2_01932 [Haloquadratum walsbyi J07HQW2]